MSKTLTPFEEALKRTMSGYETPYEERSWFDVQRRLVSKSAGNYPVIVALVATCLVTAAGSVGLYRHRHTSASAELGTTAPRFEEGISLKGMNTTGQMSATDIAQINKGLEEFYQPAQRGAQIGNNVGSIISSSEMLSATNNGTSSTENPAAGTLPNTTPEVSPIATPIKADNEIVFGSSVRQACQGVEVEFAVTDGPKGVTKGSYLWNFGDGHFSSEVNPKHKFAKAGEYDVSLSITSDDGQIRTTVKNDMITINPAPDADFVWQFVNDEPATPSVKILNLSDDASSYEWTFGDGSTSKQTSPVMPVNASGQMVALQVANEFGCTDGSVKRISVNTDFNLGAQNNITPGKETFMPSGLKQGKSNFVLSVYDKNGDKIFETSNRQKGWDGKLADGSVAPNGSTYPWKVIITNDFSKEQKYFNGTLTITP